MDRLKLKTFAAGIVLTLFVLSGHFLSVNAQSGTWKLNSVQVYNQLNSYAAIVSEKKDSTGGEVDINVNGKVYDTCPGGVEKLRFVWRFEYEVSKANPGGAFGVNLRAGQASRSEPCRTAIASFSTMTVNGSRGGSSPFPPEYNKVIDGERFVTGNGVYVWAAGEKTIGIGSVDMKTHPVVVGRNYAFFTIDIGVRGSGYVKYIYLYERTG